MHLRKNLTVFGIILIFVSCAMPYRAIDPAGIFTGQTTNGNNSCIIITCSDIDIVSPQNKWLAKKLWREELVFVPVKVENKSEKAFTISKHSLEFINDFTPVEMLESSRYLKVLRQKYWYNSLLIPAFIATSYYTEWGEFPDGGSYMKSGLRLNLWSGAIALLGIANTTRTIIVNQKTKKDILQNDLYLKAVQPGSTAYGFICIKAGKLNNPMVRIRNNELN
ncbi:MAG: hypothetical protein JW798_14950 [Prolixibacteraceae bacterium]|nr:hypothetical protein [Prolixibacteraceae bacterium]